MKEIVTIDNRFAYLGKNPSAVEYHPSLSVLIANR